MKLSILILFALVYSLNAWAFELEGYYGRQIIQDNSLFRSEDGQGSEHGGRLLFSPGSQGFFTLGAYYGKVEYDLATSHSLEGILIAGKGKFVGDYYGPIIQLTAPIPFITFFSSFSYLWGTYRYYLNKTSTWTSSTGDELTARLLSEVHMNAKGLSTTAGLKTRGRVSYFIEFGQSFQTLTTNSVQAAAVNYVNGTAQSTDGGEPSFEDNLKSLVDQSFGFSTRSILGGLEISL